MTISDPKLEQYTRAINALHRNWKPHKRQVEIGKALFRDDKRAIFVAAGRKFGKTELIMYVLWRWALMNPGRGCFYICPELKQARKLVWTDPRVKEFGPREFVDSINETMMLIRIKNGSYIQVDGSDNYESHRGSRPGLVVYEESKDHKRRFREIMRPNMLVYNAPEIHIGTPPSEDDNEEVQSYWDELEAEFKSNPNAVYFHGTCWDNPHNDTRWLENEKQRLYGRGEGHVWEREYEAKRVKGGIAKIFPMLPSADKAFTPHDKLLEKLKRDRKKLEWIWFADPAGATCFGNLFAAVNPFTKDIYWLDEIYETQQAEMTVKRIGKRIIQKRDDLFDDQFFWRQGYDEAATWFANEWQDNFPNQGGVEPSHKHLSDKNVGLSLMKDIMLAGKWHMSERCQKFFWELDNYKKDSAGRIPKKNDHLIDCARYILGALSYELTEEKEKLESDDEDFRGSTISQDFPGYDDMGTPMDELDEYSF